MTKEYAIVLIFDAESEDTAKQALEKADKAIGEAKKASLLNDFRHICKIDRMAIDTCNQCHEDGGPFKPCKECNP